MLEADVERKSNLANGSYDQARRLQADLDEARKTLKALENKNNILEVSRFLIRIRYACLPKNIGFIDACI